VLKERVDCVVGSSTATMSTNRVATEYGVLNEENSARMKLCALCLRERFCWSRRSYRGA
jgi:hypothetical protein